VPSGSSLLMEVYDHGVRLFFWSPSQPSHEEKARYLAERRPMSELYGSGVLQPTAAFGCVASEPCPVEALAYSFLEWVTRTGTYVRLCNVSVEDTYFAKGEASLGVMEDWVQPAVLAARGVNVTRPSAQALGLTDDDAEALGFSLATATEDAHLRGAGDAKASGDGAAAATRVVAVAAPMALIAGSVGYVLGRASGLSAASPEADACYVAIS